MENYFLKKFSHLKKKNVFNTFILLLFVNFRNDSLKNDI